VGVSKRVIFLVESINAEDNYERLKLIF